MLWTAALPAIMSALLFGCVTDEPAKADRAPAERTRRTEVSRLVGAATEPEQPIPPWPPRAIAEFKALRAASNDHAIQQPGLIGPATPRDEVYPSWIKTNTAGNWVHEFQVDKDWTNGYVIQSIPLKWQTVSVLYRHQSNVVITAGSHLDKQFRLLRITQRNKVDLDK